MQRELAVNTQGLLMDISAHMCILKHSSNAVAQLTKIVAQLAVAQLVCRPDDRTPKKTQFMHIDYKCIRNFC